MNERQRLEQVIESEKMTAKQFAQEVGIQAGTISNILSGRNNPSLDVLQRVLNRFRALSSDWLILGVGPMYRQNGAIVEQSLFDMRPEDTPQMTAATDTQKTEQSPAPSSIQPTPVKLVDKILIFYTDGTFEER
ncbi:MAG: helix-turn-helix domain-containing protein [Paludibacteraceae bacterium]|nr:helix-turn-helix domain-containing protein [Paludibacteraceae bacterium]